VAGPRDSPWPVQPSPSPPRCGDGRTVQAGAAAAGPVSVLKFTVKERKDALAYWTPARMKAVGKSVDLGPTGPKAKPWTGTELKTVGRLFFVNARATTPGARPRR